MSSNISRSSNATSDNASGAVWVLITFLILIVVLGVLYFGGGFATKSEIDTNINKPGILMIAWSDAGVGSATDSASQMQVTEMSPESHA